MEVGQQRRPWGITEDQERRLGLRMLRDTPAPNRTCRLIAGEGLRERVEYSG